MFRTLSWRSSRSWAEQTSQSGGTLPPRLRALSASSSRNTSVAARVHKGATVAVLLPASVTLPTAGELSECGLMHPPDTLGWYALTDGSQMAILKNDKRDVDGDLTNDKGWASHGQAKGLRHAQVGVLKLLERYVPTRKRQQLRIATEGDCHDVIASLIPGCRIWPLSDVLVSRVITLNIARERFRSVANFLRLDRGPRFLDLMRVHYGEEVAFLFAWHAHYMHMLSLFVLCSVPFIIRRTIEGKGFIDNSMMLHSVLTIFFGVLVNSLWQPRVNRLVHRWHTHGDASARWHHLVLNMFEASAMAARLRQQQEAIDDVGGVDGGAEAMAALPVGSGAACSPAGSGAHGAAAGAPPRAQTGGAGGLGVADVADVVNARRKGFLLGMPGRGSLRDAFRRLTQTEQQATTACRETCQDTLGWESLRAETCSQRCLKILKGILKMLIVIPVILVEWALILAFFTCIVWFEIWVIFEWGGCKKLNMENGDWSCMAADTLRGMPGIVMGALPSICEGAFFELLLTISKFTSHSLISLHEFSTREQRDFAVVVCVFLLEVVGKVGFISVLGLGFVPTWKADHDKADCNLNWDYWLMGEWSLGCLKGEIPEKVRLKLFESAMKGPMLVSGLVGILVKVLLPMLLECWRRGVLDSDMHPPRGCCRCRRHRLVRCLLAPWEFVLRTCILIFQSDFSAVGGLRILCLWPPKMAEEKLQRDAVQAPLCAACVHPEGVTATALERASQKFLRLQAVLLEGDRREHQPFDEYIELLLHFLWTSCFAIVWPLGTVFSLLNQFLEFRFDTVKLLTARRRRFPSTRHMSVAWVPQCAQMVSHISIVVNVALLLLPYKQLGAALLDWPMWRIAAASLGTWLLFLAIRFVMFALVRLAKRRCTDFTWPACEGSSGASRPAPLFSERSLGATPPPQGLPQIPDDDQEDLLSVDSLGMRRGEF